MTFLMLDFFHMETEIQNCMSDESAAIMSRALISSKLDYRNSLLHGLQSVFQIQRLQTTKRNTARILNIKGFVISLQH